MFQRPTLSQYPAAVNKQLILSVTKYLELIALLQIRVAGEEKIV